MTQPLAALLPPDLALDDPDVAGPLTLFPLLATGGQLEYRSLAEAMTQGFVVKELDRASVNDLLAVNPLDVPVLLYEGEEVVGAQQDRTLDVSVLVPAGAHVTVPVSCVERGRWDGSRHGEHFAPSPRSAFPALRAAKNRRARMSMAAGLEARADQGEVWQEVEEKALRMDAASPTDAMGGIFEGHEDRLAELEARVSRRDGQVGALACIGGSPTVLDLVSRTDVFASLFRPLVRGYCIDALEHGVDQAPDVPDAEAFVAAARDAVTRRSPGVGLGDALAFSGRGVGGSGLAVSDELVQLSAFAEDGGRGSRILRPARRR